MSLAEDAWTLYDETMKFEGKLRRKHGEPRPALLQDLRRAVYNLRSVFTTLEAIEPDREDSEPDDTNRTEREDST